MSEKRKYSRVKHGLPIKLQHQDYDVVTETKDISGNGAYCAVSRAIAPMTKIDIIILIPQKTKNKKSAHKKIHCQGVVVRNQHVKNNGTDTYYVGIYFSEITPPDRKLLISFIEGIPSKKSK